MGYNPKQLCLLRTRLEIEAWRGNREKAVEGMRRIFARAAAAESAAQNRNGAEDVCRRE